MTIHKKSKTVPNSKANSNANSKVNSPMSKRTEKKPSGGIITETESYSRNSSALDFNEFHFKKASDIAESLGTLKTPPKRQKMVSHNDAIGLDSKKLSNTLNVLQRFQTESKIFTKK